MILIKEQISSILDELASIENKDYKVGKLVTKIPTLENGVYRKASPMLIELYKSVYYLLDATHGDWLSVGEMKAIWSPEIIKNERIRDIYDFLVSNTQDWENNAGSVFQKNRLSLFAGSSYTNEHIYLLWLDHSEEPEFWVYDVNGETRYKNLHGYLQSYINDDLSNIGKTWHF